MDPVVFLKIRRILAAAPSEETDGFLVRPPGIAESRRLPKRSPGERTCLDPEVWLEIFSYLRASDVVSGVLLSCRSFYKLIRNRSSKAFSNNYGIRDSDQYWFFRTFLESGHSQGRPSALQSFCLPLRDEVWTGTLLVYLATHELVFPGVRRLKLRGTFFEEIPEGKRTSFLIGIVFPKVTSVSSDDEQFFPQLWDFGPLRWRTHLEEISLKLTSGRQLLMTDDGFSELYDFENIKRMSMALSVEQLREVLIACPLLESIRAAIPRDQTRRRKMKGMFPPPPFDRLEFLRDVRLLFSPSDDFGPHGVILRSGGVRVEDVVTVLRFFKRTKRLWRLECRRMATDVPSKVLEDDKVRRAFLKLVQRNQHTLETVGMDMTLSEQHARRVATYRCWSQLHEIRLPSFRTAPLVHLLRTSLRGLTLHFGHAKVLGRTHLATDLTSLSLHSQSLTIDFAQFVTLRHLRLSCYRQKRVAIVANPSVETVELASGVASAVLDCPMLRVLTVLGKPATVDIRQHSLERIVSGYRVTAFLTIVAALERLSELSLGAIGFSLPARTCPLLSRLRMPASTFVQIPGEVLFSIRELTLTEGGVDFDGIVPSLLCCTQLVSITLSNIAFQRLPPAVPSALASVRSLKLTECPFADPIQAWNEWLFAFLPGLTNYRDHGMHQSPIVYLSLFALQPGMTWTPWPQLQRVAHSGDGTEALMSLASIRPIVELHLNEYVSPRVVEFGSETIEVLSLRMHLSKATLRPCPRLRVILFGRVNLFAAFSTKNISSNAPNLEVVRLVSPEQEASITKWLPILLRWVKALKCPLKRVELAHRNPSLVYDCCSICDFGEVDFVVMRMAQWKKPLEEWMEV